MKKKKNIFILGSVVLFIWGILAYQLLSFLKTDEEPVLAQNDFVIKPFKITKRKTLEINVNYRDPFLGKAYGEPQKTIVQKSAAQRIPKKIKEIPAIIWPQIKYKGMIANSKKGKMLFLVIINGKNNYMIKGSTANEIFLKDGNKESITVKYKGNLNMFLINE